MPCSKEEEEWAGEPEGHHCHPPVLLREKRQQKKEAQGLGSLRQANQNTSHP